MEERSLVYLGLHRRHVPKLASLKETVDLLGAFLADRPTTLRAYVEIPTDFATYLGLTTAVAAVETLIDGLPAGPTPWL